MARTKSNGVGAQSTANIGFEAKLWLTADKLRNNMDAAEYKHVVLGLIFLKYISDAVEGKHVEDAAMVAIEQHNPTRSDSDWRAEQGRRHALALRRTDLQLSDN